MKLYLPVIAPAVVAGLCLLIAWQLWRRRNPAANGGWGGALAFGLGYFTGHVVLVSWPLLPPVKAQDWMAYLALAVAAVGGLQVYWGEKWYTRWPVRVLVSAGVLALLLRSYWQHTWSPRESAQWLVVLTVATLLLWETLERLAARRTGASLPLSLWLWLAGTSVAFVWGGTALLGQLAGSLAAVCGAAVVLAWWSPKLSLRDGAMAALAPIYAGLLTQAVFYADLPFLSASFLYAAPFALWFGERRAIHFGKPWKSALLRLAIIGVPVLFAVIAAALYAAGQSAEEYYY